jgi:hypothetical protein
MILCAVVLCPDNTSCSYLGTSTIALANGIMILLLGNKRDLWQPPNVQGMNMQRARDKEHIPSTQMSWKHTHISTFVPHFVAVSVYAFLLQWEWPLKNMDITAVAMHFVILRSLAESVWSEWRPVHVDLTAATLHFVTSQVYNPFRDLALPCWVCMIGMKTSTCRSYCRHAAFRDLTSIQSISWSCAPLLSLYDRNEDQYM